MRRRRLRRRRQPSTSDAQGDLDERELNNWLERLYTAHGPRLFRAKGILYLSGSDRPAVLHGVGTHVDMVPVEEGTAEMKEGGERHSRLVFIGDVARLAADLQRQFAALP